MYTTQYTRPGSWFCFAYNIHRLGLWENERKLYNIAFNGFFVLHLLCVGVAL